MTLPNAALVAEGASFLVDAAGQSGPSKEITTVLANGQFVVVWQEATGRLGDLSGSEIIGKILNADGTVAVADFLLNTTTAGNQALPDVAALTGGGFVASWEDQASNGSATDVRFQVFNASGQKTDSEILGSGTEPGTLSSLSNGNLILGGRIRVAYSPGVTPK